MGVLDVTKEKLIAKYSDWIKVEDNKSRWTIEDFPYVSGVDEEKTNPHCWRCVTVNRCWFKNEEGKKPKTFSNDNNMLDSILKQQGLYHNNCHCKEKGINVPREYDLDVLEVRPKFNDFFRRKKGILYGIGYTYKDEADIISFYLNEVKKSYRAGDYVLYKHWEYGFQINIIVSITGKNEFKHIVHKFKTGLFVYPNGKLKIATVFAGGV